MKRQETRTFLDPEQNEEKNWIQAETSTQWPQEKIFRDNITKPEWDNIEEKQEMHQPKLQLCTDKERGL